MSFAVSLPALAEVVDRMVAYDRAVGGQLERIDAQVRGLAMTWTGAAAASYETAHAQWTRDLAQMREAALRLRAVVATAHGNYAAAVAASRAMWT